MASKLDMGHERHQHDPHHQGDGVVKRLLLRPTTVLYVMHSRSEKVTQDPPFLSLLDLFACHGMCGGVASDSLRSAQLCEALDRAARQPLYCHDAIVTFVTPDSFPLMQLSHYNAQHAVNL